MTNKFKINILLGLSIVLMQLFPVAYANNLSWPEWVHELKAEALQEGIRPEVFDEAFTTVSGPSQKILNLNRSQPEQRLTFLEYRKTRADSSRIRLGQEKFRQYQSILTEVGESYGVNPCIITALWGMETSYGSYMGTFPVFQSLATLAYSGDRQEFFRQELLEALQIYQGGHVSLQNFVGEWAGASGQPQFLPSSWAKYAVDYEHTGRKDIWKSMPDAFASIANYLVKNGWQSGQPWGSEVYVPPRLSQFINSHVIKSVAEWRELGVRISNNDWPEGTYSASIIEPDGGPTFMVFNNFNVLWKWNNSNYYVATVGYLSDQICKIRQ